MGAPAEAAPLLARLRSPRPLAHEWVALAFVVVGILVLENLPVTYPRRAIVAVYGQFTGLLLVIAGVTLAAAAVVRRRLGSRPRDVRLADDLLVLGRATPALLLVLAVHFLLKSFIHLVNPRVWDRELHELDRILHAGIQPGTALGTILGWPPLLHAVDFVYSGLYYPVLVGSTAVLLTLPALRRRLAFLAAFLLTWIAGTVLYIALPSWGPVFVVPHLYEDVLQSMPATVRVQSVLFQEISSLVRDPLGARVVRYGCVAAFPSLHVAAVALITFFSRPVSRRWHACCLAFLAVMIVGSALTGYHYLVDAWAGLLLAAGAWWVGHRLFPAPGPSP